MKYKVLKDFKGSPDGRFAVDYQAGQEVDLTTSLAEVALAEKWAEPIDEATAPAVPATKPSKEKKAKKV